MDLDRDLASIAEQERRLRFPRFDAGTAWALGARLKAAAEARGAAVTIEIRLAGSQLERVLSYAETYRHLGVPLADLVHEGNLSLVDAAPK